MSTLPRVVIVGRMNVGKSTLFNRLSVDVKSLAFDYEGVTRDFLKDTISWQGRSFELIDTGGVSIKKSQDFILEQARQRALEFFETADVVLLVCDGKVGVLPEDRFVSKLLHKMGKKVLLVVNKIDASIAKEQLHEFDKLGHKSILPISAQHSTGIADLLEGIIALLPTDKKEEEEEDPSCKVVILGKPNVGKSSLLNALLKQDRAIVADIPGTTREAITEKIRFFKEDIQITDTPGLRRKRGIKEELEGMMVKSALRAAEKADIVLLVVDASAGTLADQELKLAFYVFEELKKALIILFNKQDLVEEFAKERLAYQLEEYPQLMKKVETLDMSCKTGKNIGKVVTLVNKVSQRYMQELPVDDLSLFFKEALHRRPLYCNKRLLHVYRAEQVKSGPLTILLKVNAVVWFGPSQLGYFENQLRRTFDLKGVPMRFIVRKR